MRSASRKANRTTILALLLLLPFYRFLLGAADLRQQLDIRINNGTQGPDRDEADRLVRFGGQAQRQGNFDKAISYWMQALKIYHQIGDFEAMGSTYDFIGLAYVQLRQYQTAEDALRRRLGLARINNDYQGQIAGLNNVGTVLLRYNLPAARTSFEEALAIARRVKDGAGEGISLSNLGLVAAGQKDYYQAIQLYEAALSRARRYTDPLGEANTLNNLGDAYRAVNRYRDTINAYGGALRIARESRDLTNEFRAIDSLVAVYSNEGNFTRALELLDRRIELVRQEENLPQKLKTFQLLAGVYQKSGKYGDAAKAYRKAFELAQALGDRQTASVLLYQLDELPPEALSHR